MDFSIKTFDAKTTIIAVKTGCIAVGVYENKKLYWILGLVLAILTLGLVILYRK